MSPLEGSGGGEGKDAADGVVDDGTAEGGGLFLFSILPGEVAGEFPVGVE